MTWQEALAALRHDLHHWRYAELCDESFIPVETRDAFRARVIEIATGQWGSSAPPAVAGEHPLPCCGGDPYQEPAAP